MSQSHKTMNESFLRLLQFQRERQQELQQQQHDAQRLQQHQPTDTTTSASNLSVSPSQLSPTTFLSLARGSPDLQSLTAAAATTTSSSSSIGALDFSLLASPHRRNSTAMFEPNNIITNSNSCNSNGSGGNRNNNLTLDHLGAMMMMRRPSPNMPAGAGIGDNTSNGANSGNSSVAISQDIKRIQDLQQQMASNATLGVTGPSSSNSMSMSRNPFLYSSSQTPSLSSVSGTGAGGALDPDATALRQYLLQKAQLSQFEIQGVGTGAGTFSYSAGAAATHHNYDNFAMGLPRVMTDSASLLQQQHHHQAGGSARTGTGGSSLLELQLLHEARLLMRRQSIPHVFGSSTTQSSTSFGSSGVGLSGGGGTPTGGARTLKPNLFTFSSTCGGSSASPSPRHHQSMMSTEGSRKMRGGVIEPFPEKLIRLLTEVEQVGRTDVISFVSDGKAFAIHNSEAFFQEIVPHYFRQSRLSSFKRQLNLYGFELINTGPARGAYYHELFQRDQPELCRRMRRVAVKVTAGAAANNSGNASDSDKQPSFTTNKMATEASGGQLQQENDVTSHASSQGGGQSKEEQKES